MALPSAGKKATATPDNPSSALTDFSFIVDLSDMPSTWWADVNTTDGTRGRASKNDGTTELPCDWIDFNSTAETGLVRIKYTGTKSSSVDEPVIVYPPNTRNTAYGVSDTYGKNNAYDEGLVFSGESVTETNRTGTPNISLSTENGTPSTSSIGDFPAIDYNGSSNLESGDDSALTFTPSTDDATWSFLLNSDEVSSTWKTCYSLFQTTTQYIIAYAHTQTGAWGDGSARLAFGLRATDRHTWYVDDLVLSTATDYQVDIVYDHSETNIEDRLKIYVDGTERSLTYQTDGSSIAGSINPDGLRLGESGFTGEYLDGRVGLFSDVRDIRSSAYIAYNFSQVDDNSTFWGTWTVSDVGGGAADLNDITLSALSLGSFTGQCISTGDIQGVTLAALVLGEITGETEVGGLLDSITLSGASLGTLTGQCIVNGQIPDILLSFAILDKLEGQNISDGQLDGVTLSALVLGKISGEGTGNVLGEITLGALSLGSFTGQCTVAGVLEDLALSSLELSKMSVSEIQGILTATIEGFVPNMDIEGFIPTLEITGEVE